MSYTIVYAVIMLLLTVTMIWKRKNILGILLFVIYTTIGIISVLALKENVFSDNGLKLLPYLYLIMIYCIIFAPFAVSNKIFNSNKITFSINENFKYFAILFVASSIVFIYLYLPGVIRLNQSNAWLDVRRSFLEEGQVRYYHNTLEYIIIQFNGYFRIFALILGFLLLRLENNKILGWSTLLSAISCQVVSSMASAARGSLFTTGVFLISLYLFFSSDLRNNIKRSAIVLGGIVAFVIGPYFINVTASRNSGTFGLFILNYFGQPPIVFNRGVWTSTKLALGAAEFGKLFGYSFTQDSIGGNWGNGFYTFVGIMYMDWGTIGTLIVSLLISLWLYKRISRQEYTISDVFLIFFVYKTLTEGVFVIGRNYCYTVLGAVIVYLIIKYIFERTRFVFGTKKMTGKIGLRKE